MPLSAVWVFDRSSKSKGMTLLTRLVKSYPLVQILVAGGVPCANRYRFLLAPLRRSPFLLAPQNHTPLPPALCPRIAADDELVWESGARAAGGAQSDGPREARGGYVLRPVHQVSVRCSSVLTNISIVAFLRTSPVQQRGGRGFSHGELRLPPCACHGCLQATGMYKKQISMWAKLRRNF